MHLKIGFLLSSDIVHSFSNVRATHSDRICFGHLRLRCKASLFVAGFCASAHANTSTAETAELIGDLQREVAYARKKGALVVIVGDINFTGEAAPPQRPPLTWPERLSLFVEQLEVCSAPSAVVHNPLEAPLKPVHVEPCGKSQPDRDRACAQLDYCLVPYGPTVAAGVFYGLCSDSLADHSLAVAMVDVPMRDIIKMSKHRRRYWPWNYGPDYRGRFLVKGREFVSLISGTW
jgi:hypothetical protein